MPKCDPNCIPIGKPSPATGIGLTLTVGLMVALTVGLMVALTVALMVALTVALMVALTVALMVALTVTLAMLRPSTLRLIQNPALRLSISAPSVSTSESVSVVQSGISPCWPSRALTLTSGRI